MKSQVRYKISSKINIRNLFLNTTIQQIMIAFLLIIIYIEPSIISTDNVINILIQSSTRIIIALGVGGIIITKGIDLSAGRIIGLSAVLSASLLQNNDYGYYVNANVSIVEIIIVILISLVICGFIGSINGFLVAKLRIQSFIATMGTMLIAHGLSSIYFDKPPYGAQAISGLEPIFRNLAQGSIEIYELKIHYLVIYAVIISVIIWSIWNKTKFGKSIFLIGKDEENAKSSGINTVKVIIIIYMIAGVLYGVAGILEAARVGSVTNDTGFMYEVDAIIACAIGGISFRGGVGSIGKIIIGVLILQSINYGLVFIGVSSYIQFIVKGLMLIIAVGLDTRKYANKV